MNPRTAVVIAVVAVCTALAAHADPGPAEGRVQWQYQTLATHELLEVDDPVAFAFEAMGQTFAALGEDGAPGRPAYLDELDAALNRLGAEGWELIQEEKGLLRFKRRS